MSTQKLYEQAQLSEAAYADFWDKDSNQVVTSDSRVTDALTKLGFSETQAAEFVSKWRFVDHLPNTPTGFSATLFERIENPGELVFAIRGTEPSAQWGTDITLADIADIGADGIALNQAIDLMNYYQRLTTATTHQAAQYELYEGAIPPSSDIAEFQLIGPAADETGHSGPQLYRYIKMAEPTDPVYGLSKIPDSITGWHL